MLQQVYSDEAMSRTQTFEWHRHFKGGRMSLEDDEQSGRPSTSIILKYVEQIRELVHEDRRRMINDIADIVGVSYGSVQTILTLELNMRHVTAKFVPRLLTPEQKEHCVTMCQGLRECAMDNPFFTSRIITGDESWVYGYNPDTKRQLSQWKSPSSP
jgi:histone-lysine N-methyltransferase SETMAR